MSEKRCEIIMQKLKRFVAVFTTICLLFSMIGEASAEELLPVSAQLASTAPSFSEELPAKSYILIEASTGKVLAENNADEQMPPASITKIMTMLLVMERIDSGEISLDDMVTTSEHANSMGGTQIWLEVGETMSVNDLLKATAVNSANDAAVALAEYIGGSEDAFVEMMNERAAELGMVNTTFKNATGLDADGHVSTARDIAIMSQELLKHPLITDYTSIYMDSLRGGTTELVNTNKMVRFYEGCNGLKTGTTDGAGSCLSASATRDGMTLIAVTMGSPTSKERFASARSLLDYGFANYSLFTPEISDDELTPILVKNGQKSSVSVELGEQNSIVLPKGSLSKMEHEVILEPELQAPVAKGTEVGQIIFSLDGQSIAELPVLTSEDVDQLDFGFVFVGMLKNLLGIK